MRSQEPIVESFACAGAQGRYSKLSNLLLAEYMLLGQGEPAYAQIPEMTELVGGLRVLGANYKRYRWRVTEA